MPLPKTPLHSTPSPNGHTKIVVESRLRLPPDCSPFVLLLAASKGNTGKSTLAINLAVAAVCGGLRTLVIDTDIEHGQQTCVTWSQVRKDPAPHAIPARLTRAPEAIAWAKRKGFEFIVIDTAGRDLVALPAVTAAAHFMLTPSQPSPADLAATAPMRRLWAQGTTQAAIVLNCVTRGNTDRTRSYLRRYAVLGSILPSVVARRVQYIDAQDHGLGVSEYQPGGAEDLEMRTLLDGILSRVAGRRS